MLNTNYKNLKDNYLFSTVGRKTRAYMDAHPNEKIIKMGIGDVTKPLTNQVTKALHDAVDEMGSKDSFRGYGPEQGYNFLREAISDYYSRLGVQINEQEVFISDGAKSDVGNILDLFSETAKVLIPDPVYPVYFDTNVMDGRTIMFADANGENDFLPMPNQDQDVDLIYLCSPNNPTGAVYTHEQLQIWVDYANEKNAIILFDNAYEAFITEGYPRSIFEVSSARTCAIEVSSFSKTAGFTGLRCSYTVVPKELNREDASLHSMWLRRQSTKFNGVPYIVQKAAEAALSENGLEEIRENIRYYQRNAQVMMSTLDEMGWYYTGGKNSPYIWFKCPNNMDSWSFFDELMEKAQVVGTPGEGFGKNGAGYFRLTAFGSYEDTLEAMERLKKMSHS